MSTVVSFVVSPLNGSFAIQVPVTVGLSGSGTLTASGIVKFIAVAGLSGSGTLTASGIVTSAGSASLSGSGTLTAGWTNTIPEAASLSGSGTLTATGSGAPIARPPLNLAGRVTNVTYDASITVVAPDCTLTAVTYSSTITVLANTLGCTLAAVTFNSTTVGWTMQQASITLSEFNDQSINLAITQNGVAVNLTGQNVQMLLKTAAGTTDASALTLSSSGGSPAITITNAAQGLATVTIPSANLSTEQYNFYRVDVISSGALKNTCVYGPINWITL